MRMYACLVLLAVLAGAAPPGADATTADGPVTASELLGSLPECRQASYGRYATDRGEAATVPVCDAGEAVWWTADMDIDCDGRETARCNRSTDPSFQAQTAFRQSDGEPLVADRLPYVVVPVPSHRWNHWRDGVPGGGAVAVVYRDRVVYGVVGDTGPAGAIGEASYAAAEALGIDPDPATGGAPDGVTYVFFRHSRVDPIESPDEAARVGEELARRYVAGLPPPL